MDDIYLLAVPAAQSKYDPEEDMERQHAVKMEKLRTAELLVATPDVGKSAEQQKKEEAQMQGMASRIIDNLQITVKRVHLRYEDSIGDHPFAGGITLGGFSAQSTDENWEPSYIVNATQGVHKLANLESLAVYFDTDSPSLAGLPPDEAVKRFTDLIASQDNQVEHQFVLKPVSGQGRLLLHKRWDLSKPKTSADLIFKEIGLALDDDQYRAVNQMYDLLQQYARQREYMPFRPPPEDFTQNKARARLIYACRSIRNDIRQKHRPYTWQALFERRDDRKAYIDLYKKRSLAASQAQQPQPEIDNKIDELEHKLSYRDIRFFRSLAKAELRRDEGHSKALAEKQQNDAPKENQAAAGGGWLGWIWGGAGQAADGNSVATTAEPHPEMDESSRKQLNDFFDWDQTDIQAISDAIDMPPEAVRLRVHAKLDKGSFVLKRDPHGENRDMIALVFDAFSADYLQRPENLEAAVALGGMRVQDYTCPGSLHTEVLRVKADGTGNKRQLQLSHSLAFDMPEVDEQFQNEARSASDNPSLDKPFFFVKFERKPLDKRADVGVTMRLRYTEIFYRAAFVEEVFRFFSPPKSELESRTALISAASETIEGLRRATRAQVEFALEQVRLSKSQLRASIDLLCSTRRLIFAWT